MNHRFLFISWFNFLEFERLIILILKIDFPHEYLKNHFDWLIINKKYLNFKINNPKKSTIKYCFW